ncbi:hypothetical protein [Dongia sp.]|uniref:hypothetical protein n=1 Tax=Dongia sp. TaxID=1977262 RepID=UPI003751D35F
METQHYWRLGAMAVFSFIAMYILTYAMVDTIDNVYMSLNQVYMAALMMAPMMVFEIFLMGMMYKKRVWNWTIDGASVVLGIVVFVFIRQQTVIGDRQFLRSCWLERAFPRDGGGVCRRADISVISYRTSTVR